MEPYIFCQNSSAHTPRTTHVKNQIQCCWLVALYTNSKFFLPLSSSYLHEVQFFAVRFPVQTIIPYPKIDHIVAL